MKIETTPSSFHPTAFVFAALVIMFLVILAQKATADTYTVKAGDTVARIAAARNISVPLREELNGRTLTKIKIGERLIIPPRGIDQNFLAAVAAMESRGIPEHKRDAAVGDHGRAIGRYQLWAVYVDDVNAWRRQHRLPEFKYSDRTNRLKSEAMVVTYMIKYHQTLAIANALRLHNGGPNWRRSQKTARYANKALTNFWPKAR